MATIRVLKGKDKRIFKRESGVEVRSVLPPTVEGPASYAEYWAMEGFPPVDNPFDLSNEDWTAEELAGREPIEYRCCLEDDDEED